MVEDDDSHKRRVNEEGEETKSYQINGLGVTLSENTFKKVSFFPDQVRDIMVDILTRGPIEVPLEHYISCYDKYHNTPGLYNQMHVYPNSTVGHPLPSDPADN